MACRTRKSATMELCGVTPADLFKWTTRSRGNRRGRQSPPTGQLSTMDALGGGGRSCVRRSANGDAERGRVDAPIPAVERGKAPKIFRRDQRGRPGARVVKPR